ncbi:tetratricopeptide repeat protein [Oceanispirochaeta sp. M2]|nr:tetratricopeptide repeat protein [Oceanispirochaeta sp. M2]MBF9015058.1 tetratricopeptide repeat protein [Oceanispirochaeta sp. M2]NPD71516.1 tetratricopeptide repeat protein [Oceanispirochaeta sp. M1]RDG33089.1 tetratricopeptide repeat protein [Oceanispirochaeta sp. M1]
MMQKNKRYLLTAVFFFSVFLLTAQQSPLELYEDGRHALRSGDYYSSLDLFKKALAVNSAYVDARKGMAEAYFLLQEYAEALYHAEAALKGADSRVDLLTLIGRIYLGMNRMEDAESQFQKALAMEPNNAEAAYGKAEIAVFRGNYSEGTGLFERSLTINPDSRRALLSLSLLHEDSGDSTRSLYYLNSALEHYPQDPVVLDFAIRHYDRSEEWSRAEALAIKWRALEPDNDTIPILLGTIYNRMGRNEEAVTAFTVAVRSRQEDPLVWYMLGRSYMDLGRYEEALLSFRTVNIIDPGNEMSRLSMEYLLLNEYPIGHEERIKAGEYHFNLAKDFQKSYQYDKAMDEYRLGRLLSPLDLDGWWLYASIQNSLAYTNRYREEMTALKLEGYDNERFLRVMELLESTEDESFLNTWDGPLTHSHTPITLSLFFDRENSSMIHRGMEEALTGFIADQMMSDPHYDINMTKTITDPAEAYRLSHSGNSDFYIILKMTETERTIRMSCSIHLARTGSEVFRFHLLRSGNRRVSDVLIKSARDILNALPVKGYLMGIEEDQVLVNLGTMDALEEESEFILLRKDTGRWTDEVPYLEFTPDNLLGTVVLDDLQEEYSLGTVSRNSPFDLINAGDELYLLTEEMELPDTVLPPVNEELKSQLLRLY